ncbi:hypothetical protein O6H91_17G003400 [Diphasiastrum complanatum]|uniref:Uncharacterized protein n=1 Tax=Diphasiastrum complanatum TaxID=34168 RepID=A0ACC2B3P5_DIPCM|nr:hypothetical protein O6H91_17G003400 [Diphasiastrum complanatum]
MPELPEVEAARRAVEEHCSGRLIVRASIAEDPKVIEGVEPFSMQQTLVGKRIVAAHRKGKQLWLELDEKPWLCFQFGMAGAVHIKGIQVTKYVRSAVKEDEEWPSKFSKVFLELDNGLEMSFTDKRRFARVRLLDDPAASPPVSELGPDAFLELPREDHFYNIFTKKKMAIKALLLDQSIISGIGNWIADEVLYQARIHPEQSASSLSVEDCKRLLASISEVVKFAIEVDADCERFPREWIFHYRWGKKPGNVNGKKIEYITVGGRTSAYVPDLQKCSGGPLENANKSARKRSSKKNSVENDDPHDADNGPSMTRAKEAIPGTKARSRSASRRKVAKEEVLPSQVETEVSSEENMKYAQNRTTQQNTSEPTMQVAPAETNRRQKATKSPRRVPTKSAEATKDLTAQGYGALDDVALDAVAIFPSEGHSSDRQKLQKTTSNLYSLWPSFSANASCRFDPSDGRTTSLVVNQGWNRNHPQAVSYCGASEPFKQMQLSGKLYIKPREQFHFGVKVFSFILRRSACFF